MHTDIHTISLVIPVYNEEDNLPELYRQCREALEDLPYAWEILMVDDGSTDASLANIKALAAADPRVRYLAFDRNHGQSAAFAAGFAHAAGEVIVTLDADLQNDPADIPRLLARYAEGDVDMVIGWREKRQDTWVRRGASKLANAIRNALTGETVRDTGCSLKVLRADLARRIPVFTGMHRFLPTLMKMHGARVAEMPVHHRPRTRGVSKYGILDRAWTAWWDLLAVRWMQRRHVSWRIRETNLPPTP